MKDNNIPLCTKVILICIILLLIINLCCYIICIVQIDDVSYSNVNIKELDSINTQIDSTNGVINDYKNKLKYEVTKAASADSVLTIQQFYELIGRN